MRRRAALTVISGGIITVLAGCSSSGEPDTSDQGSDDDENDSTETNNSGELNISDEETEIEGVSVEVETSYELEIEEGTGSDEIYAVGTVENIGEITADITVDFEVHEQDGEYEMPLLETFEGVEPGEAREFRLGPARVDEEDLEDTAVNASGVRSN